MHYYCCCYLLCIFHTSPSFVCPTLPNIAKVVWFSLVVAFIASTKFHFNQIMYFSFSLYLLPYLSLKIVFAWQKPRFLAVTHVVNFQRFRTLTISLQWNVVRFFFAWISMLLSIVEHWRNWHLMGIHGIHLLSSIHRSLNKLHRNGSSFVLIITNAVVKRESYYCVYFIANTNTYPVIRLSTFGRSVYTSTAHWQFLDILQNGIMCRNVWNP